MRPNEDLSRAAGEILGQLTDKGYSAEDSIAVLIGAMAGSLVSRVSGDPDKARIASASIAAEFAAAVEKMVAIHRRHDASKN